MKPSLMTVVGALAAVAVVAAGWAGWSWWSAAHSASAHRANDRDAVLSAAGDALVALNTVDYRDPDPAFAHWLDVTTGELNKSLSGDKEIQISRATSTKTVATAAVNQAAVQDLDDAAGTARVLVVLDVRLSTNDGPPQASRARLIAGLQRTGSGWKVGTVQAGS